MNKKKIFLILVLAAIVRLWSLNSYPALNADEAAIGYNVYSLIETGMDEHGNRWPIHFQSFNDYKPGLYFYVAYPFIDFFGLNEWAVRLPGALVGVATVCVLYLFVKKLNIADGLEFRNLKLEIEEIAAFMLAISPWHIHFSRGAWEVNLATFLMLLGAYLFIKAGEKTTTLMFSALFFALSLYSYHAARVVVPLFVLGLVLLKKDLVRKNIKSFLLVGLVGLVAVLPLINDFTSPAVSSRAAGVGLFADVGPFTRINEQRGEHADFNALFPKLLHNKPVNYTLAFLENWTDHYHGEFLFVSGDEIQRNKVPETGQMYLIDILFIVVGIFWIIREVKGEKSMGSNWWVVLLWLFVAPTAAALTFQSPHALRAHNMVIPLTIISSFGFYKIASWIKKQKEFSSMIYALALIVTVALSFTRYLHMYWVHLAKEYPFATQWGMEELVGYVEDKNGSYKNIVVTDAYDQPYIHFLFYMKYPPGEFQNSHVLTKRDEFGFSTVSSFDKYIFKPIDFESDRSMYENALIVGADDEVPNEANIIKEIEFPGGEPAFQLVD